MTVHSAGILAYRHVAGSLQVLLGHPGGPFWAAKDEGAWSIPKGEYDVGTESVEAAARREFAEETGCIVDGDLVDLGEVRQRSGKVVRAFGVPMDLDVTKALSNTFEMEWPPHSGQREAFPEIDRLAWFGMEDAGLSIVPAQAEFLSRLARHDASGPTK